MTTNRVVGALACVFFAGCGGVSALEDPDAAPAASDGGVDGGADAATDAAPLGDPHLAFVTSIAFNGLLGGLDGADALCQERANRGLLQGTYVAILSDATRSLEEKLPLTGPVHDLDGVILADTPRDFFDGTLRAPNTFTEAGNRYSAPTTVWLDASALGDCDNWTNGNADVNGGTTVVNTMTWTQNAGSSVCSASLPIQCISMP